MSMFSKKALRLTTAALLAGATLGAQQFSAHPAGAAPARAAGVVAITDWQTPDACGQPGGTVVDTEVCNPMLRGMFDISPVGGIHYYPDQAENIPTLANHGARVVNGNLVVDYKLKNGLQWSDGSPINADDLMYATDLSFAAGNTVGYDQIISKRKLDNLTVEFTYKGKYASYYQVAPPVVLPKNYLIKKYGTSDIKAAAPKYAADAYFSPSDLWNGPYKLQSVTGTTVVEVPNPNYHAFPETHARLQEFRFVNITTDSSQYAAALLSKGSGIDEAEDFQEDDIPVLQRSSFKHKTIQPALLFEHLELNTSGKLRDIRLRKALLYAIDKPVYYHALFPFVPASTVNGLLGRSPFPNTSPWVDRSLPNNQYNPAEARRLIQQAGYSTDYRNCGSRCLTLVFATTNKPVRQRSGQIIERFLNRVGIHLIQRLPGGSGNGGLFSDYTKNGLLQQGRFDIGEFAWSISPDPQGPMESFFDPKNIPSASKHGAPVDNYARVTDQTQFNVLTSARYQLDAAQRHATFNRWQHIIMGQVYWIPLYDRANITVDNGAIGNYEPNPTAAGNEWNIYSWYRAGAQ